MNRIVGLLLVLLLALPGWGATYYVDPAAGNPTTTYNHLTYELTGGSDTCYSTVAGAHLAYGVGDTIALRAGKVFREGDISLHRLGGSLTSFGGTDTLGKPQLRYSRLIHGTVGESSVTAVWTDVGGGIWSTPVAAIRASAVICWLDTYTPLVKAASSALTNPGTFWPDSTNVLYVLLPNSDSPEGHVLELSSGERSVWIQQNSTISDIWILHGDSVLFSGVEVYGTSISAGSITNCQIGPTGGYGVYLLGDSTHSVSGFSISNSNIGYNWNGTAYPSGVGGGVKPDGADAGAYVSNVVISRNCFRSNYQHIPISYAKDTLIASNVMLSALVNGVSHTNGIAGHPTVVANNTFVHSAQDGEHGHAMSAQVNGNYATFQNNICYLNGMTGTGSSVHCVFVSSNSTTGIVLDHNAYYVIPGAIGCIGQWGNGSLRTSLLDWQADTGQESNSINSDPIFFNPATGDFRLKKGSPCINAGTNLGDDYDLDYLGYDQDRYGSGWEIGAYVYRPKFIFTR